MEGDGHLEGHGALRLPGVRITGYNLELRAEGGFLGDKASETAFRDLLDHWRETFAGDHGDPLGETPTEALRRGDLDAVLEGGHPAAAGALHGAAEEFAHELADVVRRFLETPDWRGVQRIVCGGGFQTSHIGRRITARAGEVLAAAGHAIELRTLTHDPDDAGMIGWVHAAPRRLLDQGEAFLAVDIGGTNLRCGLVAMRRGEAGDGARAEVVTRAKWCHAEDEPERDETVAEMARLLRQTAREAAKAGLRLAPFVGLCCPGVIAPDGRIRRGDQNLPGDWRAPDFHLATRLRALLDGGKSDAPLVLLHNDAVMQGLSDLPFCRDVSRWGVLTIGTGLGNAAFENL